MKPGRYVGLALAFCLLAVSAQGVVTVRFSVDNSNVATLQSVGYFPYGLRLAGRSGPVGHDERSGLFDNLWGHAYWYDRHDWITHEDAFDSLDISYWGLYGEPEPHLLMDFGNPAPCLMTSGDMWYSSGVYELLPVPSDRPSAWGGWYVSVDVHVNSTDDFHSVEFGFVGAAVPSGPPGEQTLEHLMGMTWSNNAQGENVVQCVTDLDYAEVPAGPWTGGWHTLHFCCEFTSAVEASSWTRIKAMFQ